MTSEDIRPAPEDVSELLCDIAWGEALTADPVLARLLRRRGVLDEDAARRFISPSWEDLTSARDFAGVAQATEILVDVCKRGGRVFVAGDYDVDGLCATALAVRSLRRAGADVNYAIPNRLSEGYDLSLSTVERAQAWGADVLMTVDCGVRALEAVDAARAVGLTTVITDHHRLGPRLPAAEAVVASALMPTDHPARGLAGVGVTFKLVAALAEEWPAVGDVATWLPLVALGTVCDVVDLTGENRILASLGLKSFPGDDLPGLKALLAEASLMAPTMTAWHLAFVVGPRLNAAGRMGHAEYALSLLLTDDDRQARELARRLESFNRDRKRLEEDVATQAADQIGAQAAADRKTLVGYGAGWHTGVIGIVASQLVEKYQRPVILIGVEGNTGRGSCRSVPDFDIHTALTHVAARLTRFGGHSQAAGFEIRTDEIPAFCEELEAYAREAYHPRQREGEEPVPLPLGAVDEALVEDLTLLEPTGQGNAEPEFYALTSLNNGAGRVFKNAHLEVLADTPDGHIRGIGFNLAREGNPLAEVRTCGVVYKPQLDRRGGVELKITRLFPHEHPAPLGALWIDRRDGGIADSPPHTEDVIYGLPGLIENIENRWGATVCPFGQYVRRPAARVIVAHPPYHGAFLALLATDAREVVLAYGDDEVRAAYDFLEAHFPDREALIRYYRDWREGLAEAPYLTDGGAKRALAIFRELGLVLTDDGGDRPAPLEGEKKPLASSLTFARCQRRREAARAFVAKMTAWPPDAIAHLAAGMTLSLNTLTRNGP